MKARRRKPTAAPRGQGFYDPRRDGLTQSTMAGWLKCRMYAKHNSEGLIPQRRGGATSYGAIAHDVLDAVMSAVMDAYPNPFEPTRKMIMDATTLAETRWRAERPDADDRDMEEMERQLAMVEAVMPAYIENWPDDFNAKRKWLGIENEFRIPSPVEGVDLRGKMDGAFETGRNSLWLFETKTRARIEADLADALPLDLQVQWYLYALARTTGRKPRGVVYNIIRRPELKPKAGKPGETPDEFELRVNSFKRESTREKKRAEGPRKAIPAETMQQFAQRCADDVRARPDFYFQRFEVAVTKDEMTAFESDLAAMVGEFVRWWDGTSPTFKNGSACRLPYPCQYLPVCGAGDRTSFTYRERAHTELSS